MALAISVYFHLFCVIVSSTRAQDFSSAAVEEGPCFFPPPNATSLLGANLVNLLNVNGATWYTPVASNHFVRTMYEFFHGQAATSQAELDAWNLVLQYLGPLESWSLYNKQATNICLLLPVVPVTDPLGVGIPIFHCSLSLNSAGVLGLVESLFSPIDISDYTIIWDDNVSNLLAYRCHDGQRDWVLFTANEPVVSSQTLENHVYPFLEQYGFSMSNVQFLN